MENAHGIKEQRAPPLSLSTQKGSRYHMYKQPFTDILAIRKMFPKSIMNVNFSFSNVGGCWLVNPLNYKKMLHYTQFQN